jgi:hypothetical protein
MVIEDVDLKRNVEDQPRRSRARVAHAVLASFLALALGLGVWGIFALHDTNRAKATTAQTHHNLVTTLASVSAVTASLHSQEAALATAQGQALTEKAELGVDKAALTKAQATLFFAGLDVTQLNTCLNGVVRALNQLSLNDIVDATATLQSALPSCKAASG